MIELQLITFNCYQKQIMSTKYFYVAEFVHCILLIYFFIWTLRTRVYNLVGSVHWVVKLVALRTV